MNTQNMNHYNNENIPGNNANYINTEEMRNRFFCPKCGFEITDSSGYCGRCGTIIDVSKANFNLAPHNSAYQSFAETVADEVKVKPVMPEYKMAENPAPGKAVFCKSCGGKIDGHSQKCSVCGKPYKKTVSFGLFLPVTLILGVLLVISLVANIIQIFVTNDLDKEHSEQNSIISSQEDTISTQNEKIENLEVGSGYFDKICDELSYGNVGYASDNFRASESVIVVSKNETGKKFILTAHWSGGGTVSTNYSGSSATVSFDQNNWTTSVSMKVNPVSEGVTVVNFSNNKDSKTFKVIIVVTE